MKMESWEVSRKELADKLVSIRTGRGEVKKDINGRFQSMLKIKPDLLKKGSQLLRLAQLTKLETCRVRQLIRLDLNDLETIATAYASSSVLLLPLLAKSVDGPCVCGNTKAVFTTLNPGQASGATYRTPIERLGDGGGITVVKVELVSGGWSDFHWHDGEEIIIVLEGRVEVSMATAGLDACLSAPDDVIHFYSEQPHMVINRSESPAQLLVIRFEGSSVRKRIADRVETRLAELLTPRDEDRSRKPLKTIDKIEMAFESLRTLRKILRPLLSTPGTANEMSIDTFQVSAENRVQLARFFDNAIARVSETQGPTFKSEIIRNARAHGLNPSKMRRILDTSLPPTEHAKITGDEMLRACDAVRASVADACVSRILAFSLLFPDFPGAIAIRRSRDASSTAKIAGSDVYEMPEALSGGGGAQYIIPRRCLADSRASLAWLRLPPQNRTPQNKHAGYEILIPLSGEVEIRFGNEAGVRLRAGTSLYAQFSSSMLHHVENRSIDVAELLVVRIGA
jgi:uncharacterized cupin superfamily protein